MYCSPGNGPNRKSVRRGFHSACFSLIPVLHNLSLIEGYILCYVSFMKGYIMQDLQELIAGFQNRPLPASKPRAVRIKKVPGMASVVIGMRRSGKTNLLFREMERLLQNGVSHLDMLYMNFEDDRLFPLEKSILSDTLDTFYRIKPNGRGSRSYPFYDEVQAVDVGTVI